MTTTPTRIDRRDLLSYTDIQIHNSQETAMLIAIATFVVGVVVGAYSHKWLAA